MFIRKSFSVHFYRKQIRTRRQYDGDLHFLLMDGLELHSCILNLKSITKLLRVIWNTWNSQVLKKAFSNLHLFVIAKGLFFCSLQGFIATELKRVFDHSSET